MLLWCEDRCWSAWALRGTAWRPPCPLASRPPRCATLQPPLASSQIGQGSGSFVSCAFHPRINSVCASLSPHDPCLRQPDHPFSQGARIVVLFPSAPSASPAMWHLLFLSACSRSLVRCEAGDAGTGRWLALRCRCCMLTARGGGR